MWRIVVIFLALATLLEGATAMAAGDGLIPCEMHHASLSDEDAGPGCLSSAVAYEDCPGLTCCLALHCASCAVPAGSDFLDRRVGDAGRLDHNDLNFLPAGRVIAPPTAPPKSA